MNKQIKQLIVEFWGAFAIVLFGTGAIIMDSKCNCIGNFGIAITFGLVVMFMIFLGAKISGAHFNPAVTFAFLLNKNISFKTFLFYTISQLSGGLVGSLMLKILFQNTNELGLTQPKSGIIPSLIAEFLITFILMFVIFRVSQLKKVTIIGLAIGTAVFFGAYTAGPLSGASMNPARSFGPAIAIGNFNNLWIYFVSPYLGSTVAWIVFKLIKK